MDQADRLPAEAQNRLFSLGYIAKGIVYILVGGLTLATVLGFGSGGVEGPRGVLEWITQQSFGRILVGLLGVGMLCYAIWRAYCAVADPTDEGHDAEGGTKRVGYAASAAANGALAVVALNMALGSGGGGGSDQQGMVARLLQESWGQWVVGLVGAGVIGAGIYQLVKAYRAEFMRDISWRQLSDDTIRKLGRFGFFARGVVFGIIGFFLILAATRSSASEFKGTEGALEWLAQHSYGVVLLGLVSAGLLAYGAFAVVKGRYGRVA